MYGAQQSPLNILHKFLGESFSSQKQKMECEEQEIEYLILKYFYDVS